MKSHLGRLFERLGVTSRTGSVMSWIILLTLALALSLIMIAAWLTGRVTGNAGWADAFWSLGTGAACAIAALFPSNIQAAAQTAGDAFANAGTAPWTMRQLLVASLVLVWALRLGLHIAARSWVSHGEDARYAFLRETWGDSFSRRLFWFLQIQALAAVPLVATIAIAARAPAVFPRPRDLLAIALVIIAIGGEALADAQLRRFTREAAHRGTVCDEGLWRWSRHPNYFFEWLLWLAYPLMTIELSGAYPIGWLTLMAPMLMYWLLVHVSGIPPLEAHMLRSRGAAYRAYQSRVNAFFPGPARQRR